AGHLAHGQGVRVEPRRLLAAIPELKLVELRDSDHCCGSAGLYNILQPEMAARLLDKKMAAIRETGADTVAAGNPGCVMQIAKGVREQGLAIDVRHPVELLAEAYGL
ncbi:MAG: (Fe-S)-binding protein, partial [Limnochordales bacterium]